MFGPVRVFYALRANPDLGLLAAAVSVAILFSATPFLLPAISDEFGVALGTSGLLSSAQVGGFAITAFVAGRHLRTDRRYLVGASLTATAVNLLSMVITDFWLLLGVRVIAGAAAGLLTWLAWANAMRTSEALRNVAAAGPLSVFVMAPVFSYLADAHGSSAVFLVIAAASLPPALLPAQLAGFRVERRRMSPSRSNIVLIGALGLMTMAGSALFVFGAAIGTGPLNMNPTTVAVGYSLNALAGFVATRRLAAPWLQTAFVGGVAVSAAAVAFSGVPAVFVVGLAAWGFFFWLATPNILRAVAAWSLASDERVGDAQSIMAAGRAIGPAVGAALVAEGSFTGVGAFSVGGLTLATLVVWRVAAYRRSNGAPPGAKAAQTMS